MDFSSGICCKVNLEISLNIEAFFSLLNMNHSQKVTQFISFYNSNENTLETAYKVQSGYIGCNTGNGEKLSMLPGPAVPGCCLVSFNFLCYILCSRSVVEL